MMNFVLLDRNAEYTTGWSVRNAERPCPERRMAVSAAQGVCRPHAVTLHGEQSLET